MKKICTIVPVILLLFLTVLCLPAIAEDTVIWQIHEGSLYGYDADGEPYSGTQTLDGRTYTFLENGAVTANGKFCAVNMADGAGGTVRRYYYIMGTKLVTGYVPYTDTSGSQRLYYMDESYYYLLANGTTADGHAIIANCVQADEEYIEVGINKYYMENNRIAYTVKPTDAALSLSSPGGTSGGNIPVALSLRNNPGLREISVRFTFDSDKLAWDNAYIASMQGKVTFTRESGSSYTLTWTLPSDTSVSGQFATVYFNAFDGLGSPLVKVDLLRAINADGDAVPLKNDRLFVPVTCPHVFKNYVYNEGTATCTKDGTQTAWCALCGEVSDTKTMPGTKLPHTGGSATCSSLAVCTVCGSAYGSYDSSIHTHTQTVEAMPADCTNPGWETYERCTDCGIAINKTVIPAIDHKNAYIIHAVTPTCTESGHNEYRYCPDCGTDFGEKVIYAPLGHRDTIHADAEPATCTTSGHSSYEYCPYCKTNVGYRELPALNHPDKTAVAAKAATCSEEGWYAYEHCNTCGSDLDKKTIAAIGHRNEYTVDAKAPTCTTDGYESYVYCPDCGRINRDDTLTVNDIKLIAKLNHPDTVSVSAAEPTCEKEGHNAYLHCNTCGEDLGKVTTPAIGHRNAEGRDGKNPTCFEDGWTAYLYCPDCKEELNRVTIPKLNHRNQVEVSAKEATCTEAGWSGYMHCPDCGMDFGKTDYPALNHPGSYTVSRVNPTCKTDGCTEYVYCPVCKAEMGKEIIPKLNHKNAVSYEEVPATCTTEGMTAYLYCPDCGLTVGKQTIPPLNHKNAFTVEGEAATCTRQGFSDYTFCPDCGAIIGLTTIPATGHIYSNWVVRREAGLGTKGEEMRWCMRCGEGIQYRESEALTPADGVVVTAGDIDRSGIITAADARRILRMSVRLEEIDTMSERLADINADGEITAADARFVLRLSVELEDAKNLPVYFTTDSGHIELLSTEE